MKLRPTPLSERLEEAIRTGRLDPQDLRDVQGMEKIVGAGVTHVAVNGKHPRDWPIERWLAVLSFAFMVTGAIVGAIWFLGTGWATFKSQHDLIPEIRNEMAYLAVQVETVVAEQQRVRAELVEAGLIDEQRRRPPVAKPVPRATFPRSGLRMGTPNQ